MNWVCKFGGMNAHGFALISINTCYKRKLMSKFLGNKSRSSIEAFLFNDQNIVKKYQTGKMQEGD